MNRQVFVGTVQELEDYFQLKDKLTTQQFEYKMTEYGRLIDEQKQFILNQIKNA